MSTDNKTQSYIEGIVFDCVENQFTLPYSTSLHDSYFLMLVFRFYIAKWSRSESIRIAMGIGQDWNLVKQAKSLLKSSTNRNKRSVKAWLETNRAEIQRETGETGDFDDIVEEELCEVFINGTVLSSDSSDSSE